MALLPELARLRLPPNSGSKLWPILQCENVFILPGVPQYFESKLDVITTHFLSRRPLHTRKIVVGSDGQSHGSYLIPIAMNLLGSGLPCSRLAWCLLPFSCVPEVALVDALNLAVERFGDVVFGSYPIPASPDHACRVILTMESEDSDRLDEAKESLLKALPKDLVLLVEDNDDMMAISGGARPPAK